MINPTKARLIADLFYTLDTNVRNDLFNNRIADERDYVSRLVTHFNYPFGLFNNYIFNHLRLQSKWFAKVNSGHHERKFGCDSLIVFQVNNDVKVGLFEAKWPRVIKDPKYGWDYTQKKSKQSHFTDQIKRQSIWTNSALIWEMFFYEEKVGQFKSPFDKNASSCILHKYADKMIQSNKSLSVIWNNTDLENLIKSAQSPTYNGENETNIKDIVFNLLTCNYGKKITINDKNKTFEIQSNDDQEKARIPIVTFDNEEFENDSLGFMEEYQLSFFQYLKIDSPKVKNE